jgi:deazaflavin-dependent oxidoreductase (nitroreductase family)
MEAKKTDPVEAERLRGGMDFKKANPDVIEQFRGGGEIVGVPPHMTRETLILLTTVGRTSGQRRTTPLTKFHEEGDRLFLVGGNGGRPKHPNWYLNLLAEPRVTVEKDGETYEATASVITGIERERLWAMFVGMLPAMTEYLAGANRVVPVIALTKL